MISHSFFTLAADPVVATMLLTLILCAGNTTSTDHDFHPNRSDDLGKERAVNWSAQNKIKPALTKTIRSHTQLGMYKAKEEITGIQETCF